MSTIRIPAGWEPHQACLISWAVHREWGSDADAVRRELREIIVTIAEYEPVQLLVPPDLLIDAKQEGFGGNVEIVPAPVDDIWMRDILPTFVVRDQQLCAVDWNFNGWGSSRAPRPGDRLAGLMAASWSIPTVPASFVTEGGAMVFDGEGTLITTKSCLLNPNRNPAFGLTEQVRMLAMEQDLVRFGVRKVIWLEGDTDEPITSGHVDGYVLFTAPSRLLIEGIDPKAAVAGDPRERDIGRLGQETDAAGRRLEVEVVLPPRSRFLRFSDHAFAPCYLNAYVANGAVVTGKFGDPVRDEAACRSLQNAFPERDIRMIRIDHIARGGGGVHCLTKEMPQVLCR
ncbi:agmatine deiminase family protein [Bradyrhizobium diazoefficiens]|uniref:agmatine deiminase family protein n=1 Tax=Bradyrhizobium diazoefficiens TaxID=1355477 RepID=UPI0015B4E773|nr:agmatine deiminase family protein [Bradyrhizobium diazoefficiens]QLD45617.1 agmatine deiminase family protein [Bradyrhizobium diazoefficiens]